MYTEYSYELGGGEGLVELVRPPPACFRHKLVYCCKIRLNVALLECCHDEGQDSWLWYMLARHRPCKARHPLGRFSRLGYGVVKRQSVYNQKPQLRRETGILIGFLEIALLFSIVLLYLIPSTRKENVHGTRSVSLSKLAHGDLGRFVWFTRGLARHRPTAGTALACIARRIRCVCQHLHQHQPPFYLSSTR